MDNNYCIEKLGSPGRHQMKLEQRFLYDLEDCDPPEDEILETQDECKGDMLVRELKGAALRRQEEAARTEEDFKKIIKKILISILNIQLMLYYNLLVIR